VRLLSICPPDALRPYFQEGYLAGTEDITTEYESKTELDFKNRLIAKFEIPNEPSFWGRGFSKIPEAVLYPKGDRVEKICDLIKEKLSDDLLPGQLGEFIKEWAELEADLVGKSRDREGRVYSVREAISSLGELGVIDQETQYSLHELRKFRNLVVHEPKKIEPGDLEEYTQRLRELRATLR
jgi:uncharacterized protein YutE (UPF0331/DUF86 family)